MDDDVVADVVRRILVAQGLDIPGDEIAELCAGYSELLEAARRLQASESMADDIAVTFDPAATS